MFGEVQAATADAVVTNWEQIKKDEKGHASLVEGITPGLPSLLYVQKLLRKAASIGLDDAGHGAALDVDRRARARRDARGVRGRRRGAGIDGESALAAWARRFRDRFVRMEQLAEGDGVDLASGDAAVATTYWERAGADIHDH